MRFVLPTALGAIFLAAQAAAQKPDARIQAFDRYAAQAAADWQAVGLAVAVVKDGRTIFAKGYGVRELGKPDPVDDQTLFAIGSTTKAMTAAALGMLVDEGKVRWDDPVTRHLPGFQLRDPFVTRELTIRDLLTHRAGLANADVLWYRTDLSPEEVLRRARFIPNGYSFRSGFIYQNIMYAAAGAVVAAASGMPWERFIETRILGPLGMTRTVTTLAKTRGVPNVAVPHDRVDGTVRPIDNAAVDAVASAGSIWSSVSDMAKWAAFMIDTGRVNGKALLRPDTWQEIFTPQNMVPPDGFYPTAALTRPHWTTYGFGWFQHDYQGRMVQFHTGSIDGMVAIIGLIPEERLGVYVLGNLDHVEVRHALMYRAFDTWLGTGTRDWSSEFRTLYAGLFAQGDSARARAERSRVAGTSPSLPLDAYVGGYADSLAGEVAVVREGDGLAVRQSSQLHAVLEHWHYDTFRARWDNPWQGTDLITFSLGTDGKVAGLTVGGVRLGRRPPVAGAPSRP
ncbi:MAG: serine hydrolase [Gemmatimonadales bacterium]